MSEMNRRAFLTTAPAAALAATAVPEPEPEEPEYPHAVAYNEEARHALPEELHLLRCLATARKAAYRVLKKHGPGCDDLGDCMVCEDAKMALYAMRLAGDGISGELLGAWKADLDGSDD